MTKAATTCGIPWRLENGGCAALPLPPDDTIARVARAHITGLLPALGLSGQDVDDITLMVSDDGSGGGSLSSADPGHGLVGMRERVSVFGGTVTAGTTDGGGGWTVHARLPVSAMAVG